MTLCPTPKVPWHVTRAGRPVTLVHSSARADISSRSRRTEVAAWRQELMYGTFDTEIGLRAHTALILLGFTCPGSPDINLYFSDPEIENKGTASK